MTAIKNIISPLKPIIILSCLFSVTTAQARSVDSRDRDEGELYYTQTTLNARFMQQVTRDLTNHFFIFYEIGEKYFPILTTLKQKFDCREWILGYYRASLETNDIQTAFEMDRWQILSALIKATVDNVTTSKAYLSPTSGRPNKSMSKFVGELQYVVKMIEQKRGRNNPVHISLREAH